MLYYGYHLWGMHLIWWCIWIILFGWGITTRYSIPGRRTRINPSLYHLQKRFASGEITKDEYLDRRNVLERDLSR